MSYKGRFVYHKSLGNGVIIGGNDRVIYVHFDNTTGNHMFIAPECFQKDMQLLPEKSAATTKNQKASKTVVKSDTNRKKPNLQNKKQEIKTKAEIDLHLSSAKSDLSVSQFCNEYIQEVKRETLYLKQNGGKTYRITNGQKIERTYLRQNVYYFETDVDFNFPDGQLIKVIRFANEYPATVISSGDGRLIFSTDYYLGDEVQKMEIKAEPWQLLESLCERISEIRAFPTQITESLICDGKYHINYKNKPHKGQKQAIFLASHQPITFIWGPPGTGKTQTLAEIVMEALFREESVLMVSYSNVSVDGAIRRVYNLYKQQFSREPEPGVAVRYGYPKDPDVLNHPTMTSFNLALSKNPELEEERKTLLKKLDHLSQKSVEYVEAIKRLTWIRKKLAEVEKDIAEKADFLATTVSKAVIDETIFKQKFDVVIFDEVSMAYIPQIVFASSLAEKHFVCLGDFCQLPPIVQNNNDSSLNDDIFKYCGITTAVEENAGHDWLCLLDTQFRMHPKIADFVSRRMYHGLLQSGSDMIQLRGDIASIEPLSNSPIVLADLSGMMTVCSRTPDMSRVNVLSALVSAGIAINAAQNCEVGIITPYNAQARLLRTIIRDIGQETNHKITCATVHQFQGSEKDIIIYDAVDCYRMTHPGILLSSTKNNYANRLFNVAMTRAKGKFIAVVNRDFMIEKNLSNKLLFRNLLDDFCKSPYCIDGEELIEDSGCLDRVFLSGDKRVERIFLNDLQTAKESVYIDLPDTIDPESEINLTAILLDMAKKHLGIHIRSNDPSKLPDRIQKITNYTKIPIFNPITIIDKKTVWFGMPDSRDEFRTIKGTLQTKYRPVARITGTRTASSLFDLFEMSKENQELPSFGKPTPTLDLNQVKPKQTFAEYISHKYLCKRCRIPFEVVYEDKYILRCPKCNNTGEITEKDVDDYLWSENKNGTLCPKCHTSLEGREGGKHGIYIICNNNGKKHVYSLKDF